MKIVLSSSLNPTAFKSYQAIIKAFIYAGHEGFVWDDKQKSPYDMFDEIKPDVLIKSTLTNKEHELAKEYNTIHIIASSVIAPDIFLYRPVEATENNKKFFGCDYMSIVTHSPSEIPTLKDYVNKGLNYKVFSSFNYNMFEYCQDISEDLHSAALVCAGKVIATNFLNFFNYTLANENTIYPLYSKTDKFSRNEILDNKTCFSHANDYVQQYNLQDKCGVNFKELYSKFRNENQL